MEGNAKIKKLKIASKTQLLPQHRHLCLMKDSLKVKEIYQC